MEERLDRAMGTPSWYAKFHHARLSNLIALVSDHNPILLNTEPVFRCRIHKPFRFENKWLHELDIQYVVERSWRGFRDFSLLNRLAATIGTLHDWGLHVSRAWNNNKRDIEKEIRRLEENLSAASLSRYQEVKTALFILLSKE